MKRAVFGKLKLKAEVNRFNNRHNEDAFDLTIKRAVSSYKVGGPVLAK